MSAKYVYKQTEFAGRDGATNNLFTVGFYTPDDYWQPESDHESKDAAAARVHWLNGGKS